MVKLGGITFTALVAALCIAESRDGSWAICGNCGGVIYHPKEASLHQGTLVQWTEQPMHDFQCMHNPVCRLDARVIVHSCCDTDAKSLSRSAQLRSGFLAAVELYHRQTLGQPCKNCENASPVCQDWQHPSDSSRCRPRWMP